jgi:SAM-dependent methyltransferase
VNTAQHRPGGFAERALATSFDAQAAEYARLRPGYPAAAVDLAVPAGSPMVLDLGAGTGKLTGSVLNRAGTAVAVEPLPGMLAELHRRYPAALAVAGAAEHIPLSDNVVDAVVVGQAFHWFDTAPALAEMARVLRPGGTLSLLWNHDDEADPFFRQIQDALGRAGRPAGGSTKRASNEVGNDREIEQQDQQHAAAGQQPSGSSHPPFTGHRRFTDPILTEVRWLRTQGVDDLIGLLNTYSYVIRATDEIRERLAAEVRSIVSAHQATGDNSPIDHADQPVEIPAFCQVWQSTCR